METSQTEVESTIPDAAIEGKVAGPYWTQDCQFFKDTKEGPTQLTNFTAWIETQLIYHDANKTTTVLKIKGFLKDQNELPEITVDASDFSSLGWVAERWGMEPIIFPVASAERDVKSAIQMMSKPVAKHIYTHTGWIDIEGRKTFLSTSGGLSKDGLDASISVQLPQELENYKLVVPAGGTAEMASSLRLVNLGPKSVMWPILLATYRAAMGPADFAIHLSGRTGTFKSEASSLFQSHYGEGMDARHLPASWSSTANALEALAYKAKNTLMVVDDFVPVGTAWQVRSLESKADQFIRGQGNQAGRARLTDVSSMQQTFYPRGILLSTGEDIPQGHSIRARMLILELSPEDIDPAKLTAAQSKRHEYVQSMSNWVEWLAERDIAPKLKEYANFARDRYIGTGHTRTPSIIGDLIATAEILSLYMIDRKYFSVELANSIVEKARAAVLEAASRQQEYLQSADPVEALCETIRQMIGTNMAHLKTPNGGIPEHAGIYGWTEQQAQGEFATYKSNGPRIGWVDTTKGELLLDPNILPVIKKFSNGKVSMTPQTLLKRLKEAGILSRVDSSRQRNTIRMTLEGHPHTVLALSLSAVMTQD